MWKLDGANLDRDNQLVRMEKFHRCVIAAFVGPAKDGRACGYAPCNFHVQRECTQRPVFTAFRDSEIAVEADCYLRGFVFFILSPG
jgi:hypothetical protein